MIQETPTIEMIDISKLNLLTKNPRTITKEQMQKLSESIQSDPVFFYNRPVLVSFEEGKYNVYAGNQRVLAAKKLKWKQVPCIVETGLTEQLMKERIIKDNRHAGEWDYDLLANDWDLEQLIDLGFTAEELHIDVSDEMEGDEADNEVLEPSKDEDAKTKLGDIYELNGHRVICGDSTDSQTVSRVLLQVKPILMVTDPPYGVEYDASWRIEINSKGSKTPIGKVKNDDRINWSEAWLLFPGSVAYVWCASNFISEIDWSLHECGYELKYVIIWNKNKAAFGRGDYHWKHEPCLNFIKHGHNHNWQGSRDQNTVWDIESMNTNKDDGKTAHSTQKPIECMARPIRNNSAKGEGVYDPFLGSGTTLIAAEMLERICYGIELSPAYVDIIVNRWVNFMKKNNKEFTVKLNGELIEWVENAKT